MAAENAEADFELAAKQAGSSPQDPTAKPGSASGFPVPEPESAGNMLVVATAVDTATEIEADILPSELTTLLSLDASSS